jgi:hypothetical protein
MLILTSHSLHGNVSLVRTSAASLIAGRRPGIKKDGTPPLGDGIQDAIDCIFARCRSRPNFLLAVVPGHPNEMNGARVELRHAEETHS